MVTATGLFRAMRECVATIIPCAPSRHISYAINRVSPRPHLMLDVVIENAVSFAIVRSTSVMSRQAYGAATAMHV